MATPEQNTLLGIQLFAPVADQLNRQRNARTNLLLQLMQQGQEEKLKRDLADQSYARSIQLADMQGEREDARANATFSREGQRLTELGRQSDERIAGQERRQKETLDANEQKQLRNALATAYPKYAAEATRLGEKVRPITDFESWDGLGELQAEMSRLEVARVQRDQDDASTAAVGELDDAARAVQEHQRALQTAMKPSPEDEKFARARAVDQVRQAIEAGGMTGAPKPNSQNAKKGLDALLSGELDIAAKFLGAEVMGTYGLALESAMQAAPNYKSRIQQLSIAQKNYELAQRNLQGIQSDLRRASATNNPLAKKLTERRSSLQQLMTPIEPDPSGTGDIRSLFQRFTPPPAGGGVQTPAAPAAAAPLSPDEIFTGLQNLGVYERPIIQQGRARVFAPAEQVLPDAQAKLREEIERTRALNNRSSAGRLLELQRYLTPLEQLGPTAQPAY